MCGHFWPGGWYFSSQNHQNLVFIPLPVELEQCFWYPWYRIYLNFQCSNLESRIWCVMRDAWCMMHAWYKIKIPGFFLPTLYASQIAPQWFLEITICSNICQNKNILSIILWGLQSSLWLIHIQSDIQRTHC